MSTIDGSIIVVLTTWNFLNSSNSKEKTTLENPPRRYVQKNPSTAPPPPGPTDDLAEIEPESSVTSIQAETSPKKASHWASRFWYHYFTNCTPEIFATSAFE